MSVQGIMVLSTTLKLLLMNMCCYHGDGSGGGCVQSIPAICNNVDSSDILPEAFVDKKTCFVAMALVVISKMKPYV